MADTPNESTLELNVTHEMLSDLEPLFGQVTAKSPTRVAERDLGYDVQLSFALRAQFQYKRPMSDTNRGVSFSVNGDQVSTLRLRDPTRTAFLVCPVALREDEIPGTIDRTAFIDVQAVNADTSRIYIPRSAPVGQRDGEAKIKNGGYYPIPQHAIYRWEDVRQGIQNRNVGMIIRRQMRHTPDFQAFMQRLSMLENLYQPPSDTRTGSRYLPDGGKDEPVLNQEYASELTSFATEQRRELYDEREEFRPYDDEDTERLWTTIEKMAGTRHPSLFRISRSTEHILESGDSATPLRMH